MFSKFFTECFTKDNELPISVEQLTPTTSEISCILFPMDAVLFYLLKLNNSQTITTDGFSSATLKLLSSALVAPLSMLFELLFMYQYVPCDWKRSIVIPIHQKWPLFKSFKLQAYLNHKYYLQDNGENCQRSTCCLSDTIQFNIP